MDIKNPDTLSHDWHGWFRIEDSRDADYPISEVLPDDNGGDAPLGASPDNAPAAAPSGEGDYQYWWDLAWIGNQGRKPHCVAYSALHMVESGPTTHFHEDRDDANPEYVDPLSPAVLDPAQLYNRAQELDRWPGSNYDGTSVRAGMKVLREEGLISEFRWAEGVDDVVGALKHHGPVVMGSWWWDSMYRPRRSERYDKEIIEPDGRKVGGHAYMLSGVNTDQGLVRITNSWGDRWGDSGRAYVAVEDLRMLLRDGGEAAIAVEQRIEG